MHLIIGSGNVGLPLAQLFHEANIPALSTSRSGNVPGLFDSVAFDWHDASTFENPFNRSTEAIESVFITPPYIRMLESTKPFIDLAKRKGVKRFVVLSASQHYLPEHGHHAAIADYISRLGVEWAVIRPSWFVQHFNPKKHRLYVDLENDQVMSSIGDAKLGFVDAGDVAKASFQAMTEVPAHNGAYIVLGPEMLTYGDVAKEISAITGRTISYRKLTRDEYRERALSLSMTEYYTGVMCFFEESAANGGEEKMLEEGVDLWIGKRTLREYLEDIKDQWAK